MSVLSGGFSFFWILVSIFLLMNPVRQAASKFREKNPRRKASIGVNLYREQIFMFLDIALKYSGLKNGERRRDSFAIRTVCDIFVFIFL